ncbi:hypothetical protein PPERSA_11107 [Pseudocohnilembus persalinus]|uniref:TerD domain-containing protein n=1 Tax=Pseudocohnilembus persalinus TaxID=266149 RepID=A0A0V0QZ74_PSEPJ|nr:hypothetical protein PPERSA_11107 [Pseudocohnilembus persalinus]|eukprot:KRX07558.1 hypothetical protein PPERSA_11107 [Pseudocohnilembus persalinus]
MHGSNLIWSKHYFGDFPNPKNIGLRSIFGEDGLPTPEQNIAINDNGIDNLQFQELSQDSFDIDFQVIEKKQEIQKQLYNESNPNTQNREQIQIEIENKNIAENKLKEIEQILSKEKNEFNQKENNFLKKIQQLENEIEEKNKLHEELKKINESQNQQIQQRKSQMMEFNEELRGNDIKKILKEELKIEFQKTEKQLQGQLIQIQKQMDLERKKIQNLVLFDPKTIFDPQSELKMGFFFNLQKPDLDKQNFQVHCVFLNELGDLEEKIYEGNTSSKLSEGAIRHSGKKVNHIYDREIFLKLKNFTQDIKVIAFSIQLLDLKMSLKEINQLKIQFFEDQLIVQHFYVKNLDGKISLLFFLVRQAKGQWIFTQIGKDVGHNNIRSLILDNLKFTNFNLNPNIKEILEWKPGSGKVFPIKTHELIPVPQFAYENIVLGLGWKTKLDLDSSLVLLNKQGKVIENICFKNLESKDGAIKHQGDSRDGGNQGDDEQIYINLSKLDNQVHQIWVVICIYDSDQGFKSIENTYCRFLCGDTEFCRYDLSSIKDSQRNGCLISDLYKMGNKWTIKGRGYFTKDTSTSDDMIPIIQQLYENDYSSIKIIEN